MERHTWRVGGVPEHFNMPWHLAQENDYFTEQHLAVVWQDYPGGTGAMMQDLREGNLDVAVALTEGVVAEIVNTGSCRIVQYFVTSPLRWGIHVAASSTYQQVKDLRETTFAISRRGSGSHLMTYVLAQQHGWAADQLAFETVGNLDGARRALASGTADGFLWEQSMTQPWVTRGEFRRLGVLLTPWPCFVVAVRPSLVESDGLRRLLTVLHRATKQLVATPEASELIAQRYQLPVSEVQAWWKTTRWATDQRVERAVLVRVLNTLRSLAIIAETPDPETLCGGECQIV